MKTTGKKLPVTIGTNVIKEHGPVFVIAEAGVNHNGQLDLAIELVEMAARIGADAVKFQTYKPEQVCIEDAGMADYQVKNIGKKTSQREMISAFQLPEALYPPIMARCQELGIMFFSTPHGGRESARLLHELQVPAYKVASGDLSNGPLLAELAQYHQPIIMSTGMATMDEVKASLNYITSKGAQDVVVLHCTTNYPCPPEEVNMLAMKTMMEELPFQVGYSDHTANNLAAEAAALMGMATYEFHITVDKSLPGPDQKASADEPEAADRIAAIRRIENLSLSEKQKELQDRSSEFMTLMGSATKFPNPGEKEFFQMRRSLVFTHNLPAGHVVTGDDLEAKRPGNAISPMRWEEFIGRTLKKSVSLDDQVDESQFE